MFTLHIHYEPDRNLRTEWHPCDSTGPFSTLCRGTFPHRLAAEEWAQSHLRGSKTWQVVAELEMAYNWQRGQLILAGLDSRSAAMLAIEGTNPTEGV